MFKGFAGGAKSFTDFFVNIKNSYASVTAAQAKFNALSNAGFNSLTITRYHDALEGLNTQQQIAVINSSNLDAAQKKQLMSSLGLTTSTQTHTDTLSADSTATLMHESATESDTAEQWECFYANMASSGATSTDTTVTNANTVSILANVKALKQKASALWASIPALGKIAIIAAAAYLAIKGLKWSYDKLTDSAEELKKKTDELMSSYESAIKQANTNAKRVEEIATQYQRLSEGVNNVGENVSLTNDEFSEYNSLTNEIAEMFPSLIRGYTEEGNAIISLKGNVEELRDAYKEAQQEAYNLLIVSGEDSDGNDIVKEWKNLNNTEWLESLLDLGGDNIDGGISTSDAIKQLEAIQAMTAEDYRRIRKLASGAEGSNKDRREMSQLEKDIGYGSYIANTLGINENVTDEEFEAAKKNARAMVQAYNTQMKASLSNVETLANAFFMTDPDYNKLTEQSKTIASLLVNNLNEEIANGFDGEKDNVGAYVGNIVELLRENQSNPKIKEAINGLFTTDFSDYSVNDARKMIDSYIKTLAELLGIKDSELKTRIGFTTYDDAEPLMNKVKGFLSDDVKGLDGRVGELTLGDLEIAAELDLLEGEIKHWWKLLELIEEAKIQKYSEFEKIWNLSSFKETKKELIELAASGEITDETLETTEEYKVLIEETGLTAAQARGHILDMLDAVEKLAGAANGLENLQKAFEEFQEKGFVTAKTLYELPASWKELEGFDAFETIAGDPTQGKEAIDKAFDDLASEWLIKNETMKGITESNMEIYLANLKDMGITNAEEIADAYLQANKTIMSAEAAYNGYFKTHKDGDMKAFDEATGYNKRIKEALGEDYADDYNTWKTALKNKTEAYYEFLDAIGGEYDSSKSIASNLSTNLGRNASMAEIQEAGRALSKWKQLEKDYEDIKETMEFDLTSLKTDIGFDFNKKDEDDANDVYDWIEVLISRIQRDVENLGKTVDATYLKWFDRTAALKQQTAALTEEMNYQKLAADEYRAKAQEVANRGLNQVYVERIQKGELFVEEDIPEEQRKLIDLYQDLWEKALAADDAAVDKEAEIIANHKANFDMIAAEYDAKMGLIEHEASMLDGYISQTEANGHMVSTNYYDKLIEIENEKKEDLLNKRGDLQKALDDAMADGLEEHSEDWYEMTNAILEVDEAIQECDTSVIEYNNSIKELKWATFDKTQELISQIKEESDFFAEMMSWEDLFDDFGNWNEYADATGGLHTTDYQRHKIQADDYAKQIAELDKEYANDKDNEKYLEKRKEWLDAQREHIKAMQDEKNAIKDLYEEGYNVMLDALQELIDKRKEALKTTKDLYDYESNIADKTKQIASYQKQLAALEGDDSEETQAKIQQLKVSLEEAEKDLEETEYEKYLSDQEQMLDKLFDDSQDWVNERLDDIDALFRECTEDTNNRLDSILKAICAVADEAGYAVPVEIKETFSSSNGTSSTVSGIKNDVAKSKTDADNEANVNIDNLKNDTPDGHKPDASTAPNGSYTYTPAETDRQTPVGDKDDDSNADGEKDDKDTTSQEDWSKYFKDAGTGGKQNIIAEAKKHKGVPYVWGGDNPDTGLDCSGYVLYVLNQLREQSGKEPLGDNTADGMWNGLGFKVDTEKAAVGDLIFFGKDASKATHMGIYAGSGHMWHAGSNGVALDRVEVMKNTSANHLLGIKRLTGYHEGGVVGNLKKIVSANGDDSLAINTFEKGEGIIPLSMMGDWRMLINNLKPLNQSIDFLQKAVIPNTTGGIGSNVNNDVVMNITLPSVTDVDGFVNELRNNKRFEKIVQNMTVGNIAKGSNSLTKFKY